MATVKEKLLNGDHFPQKINIHFGIHGAMLQHVIAFNDLLVKKGSWINFRNEHVPHITLIMGIVKTKENYEALEHAVEEVAGVMHTFTIQLTQPYLQQPVNKFVFADIIPNEKIIEAKQKMFAVVKPFITPDRFGGPNNHPHLTLGYFPKKKNAVLPQMDWDAEPGLITEIDISRASMHGTSLPEYRKYDLAG